MGNEAHDCEELPSIESVLGAQSGVKEFEDLGARKVRGISGTQRENVQHLRLREA